MATPQNPMQPAVNSAFGNRASALTNPVPPASIAANQGAANQAAVSALDPAAMSPGVGTPSIEPGTAPLQSGVEAANAALQPMAAASADDLFAQIDAEQEADATAALPEQSTFESGLEQLREAGARIKNSFTVTPREQVETLQGTGLFDQVRMGANGVEVIRKGRGAWEPFDRDKLELLGDTLDWTRDIFETAVEGGTELASTVAGAYTTAGFGTVAANAAGGAAGAIAAKSFGDVVAQNLLGIKRDPERNMALENTTAGAIGAGFGFLGSTLARRNAERLARKAAGDKSLRNTLDTVAETMEDIETVRTAGIDIDQGGKFVVDPNIATGGADPEAAVQAKYLSDTDGYRNFITEIGDKIQGAYNSLADSVSSLAGRNANIGEDVVVNADTIRKAEGNLIGSYRKMARDGAGKRNLPAPKSTQQVNQLITQFGGSVEVKPNPGTRANWVTGQAATPGEGVSVSIKLPSTQDILRQNPGLSETQAGLLKGEISHLASRLNKKQGRMRLDDLEVTYNRLNKAIQNSINSPTGKTYAIALMDLRNSVRDDWVDMIGKVIPESAAGDYAQSVGRYREIMQATDNLGRLLDSSTISKDALVKHVFEGSKAWNNVQGIKTLIMETNPELWTNLTGEYFNRLLRNAKEEVMTTGADGAQRISSKFNFKGIANQWKKLDPRIQDELANSTGVKREGIDALMNLGQKYQNADVGFMAKESERRSLMNNVKNMVLLWAGAGGAAQGSVAANQLKNVGKDGAMMMWLQSNGNMDQIFREMKQVDLGWRKGFENAVYNWTPDAVTRPARTAIRRDAEDSK